MTGHIIILSILNFIFNIYADLGNLILFFFGRRANVKHQLVQKACVKELNSKVNIRKQ